MQHRSEPAWRAPSTTAKLRAVRPAVRDLDEEPAQPAGVHAVARHQQPDERVVEQLWESGLGEMPPVIRSFSSDHAPMPRGLRSARARAPERSILWKPSPKIHRGPAPSGRLEMLQRDSEHGSLLGIRAAQDLMLDLMRKLVAQLAATGAGELAAVVMVRSQDPPKIRSPDFVGQASRGKLADEPMIASEEFGFFHHRANPPRGRECRTSRRSARAAFGRKNPVRDL